MAVILIIEDDKDFRDMLKAGLMRKGYVVVESDNGKEALIHFKPGVIDLVITDLIMPDEDGLQVIMKLRQLKHDLKVIAISGGGLGGPGNYLDLARALGADAIFSKPFSTNDMLSRIEELLKIELSD